MAHEGLSRFVYIYSGVGVVARLQPLLHSPAFFYNAVKLDLIDNNTASRTYSCPIYPLLLYAYNPI